MAGKKDIAENDDEVKRKHADYKLAGSGYKAGGSESRSISECPSMKYPNEETKNTVDPQITATMASKASLPAAKNVGSMRNILILGTARAGKYTIAKHIATDGQDFPPQDSVRGITEVHSYSYQSFNFITIDTAGAHSESASKKHSVSSAAIKAKLKTHLEHGINLILLVVRKDCCTPEELTSLADIVEALFNAAATEYIALVHTGCENFEDDERSKYIDSFRRTKGPAGRLSSLCQKGIYAVGFPDLEQVSKNYFHLYQESINNSKQALRRLAENSKIIQPYIELFKTGFYTKTFDIFPLITSNNNSHHCPLM